MPTIQGQALLKIPAGTQSGTQFRLRGHGVQNMDSKNRGDLRVRVLVEVPTKLNSRPATEAGGICVFVRRR